jgi:hypothetical protein
MLQRPLLNPYQSFNETQPLQSTIPATANNSNNSKITQQPRTIAINQRPTTDTTQWNVQQEEQQQQ